MSALPEANNSEELEFKWGKKRGVGKQQKGTRFYESFTYDGLEYNLYDCVYLYKEGEPEPYIGKLSKIWEHIDKRKKVKVHWFFRPSEISYYLKDEKVMGNELFLASGQGVGLSNVNPLEAIAGKCTIICVSKDSRNPKPSREDLETADYLFYRTFNVESCTISDQIGDKVGDLEVKFIFNRENQIETLSLDEKSIDSGGFEDRPSKRAKHNLVDTNEDKDLSSIKSQIGNEASRVQSEIMKEAKAPSKDAKIAEVAKNLDDKPLKKLKIENAVNIPEIKNKTNNNIEKSNIKFGGDMANNKIPSHNREEGEAHPKPHQSPIGLDHDIRTEKSNEKKTNKSSFRVPSDEKNITRGEIVKVTRNPIGLPKEKTNEMKLSEKKTNKSSIGKEKKITHGEIVEVTRRPNPDKTSSWFKDAPWDARIQSAQEEGKVVLLQNLDPEYTSGEVEDIIYHAFEENCTARMVQHTAVSSPHCGQALAIFRSKEAADRVIRRLWDGCLMLSNGRPLIGSVAKIPKSSGKQSTFVGHLFIDKLKHKMPKEMKEAVSTSHYSQPNTIEYEMALDWFTLQARSDIWFKKLYQRHAKEIEKVKGDLKSK